MGLDQLDRMVVELFMLFNNLILFLENTRIVSIY